MPQIGPAEFLVVLLVGMLVFGPKRLPEVGRQVGRAMREVKRFQDTVKGELDAVLHQHEEPAVRPTSPSSTTLAPAPVHEVAPQVPLAPGAPAGPSSRPSSRFRAPVPSRRG